MLRVSSIQVSQTSPLPFHAEARKWLRADSHLGPPQWGLFDLGVRWRENLLQTVELEPVDV